MVRKPPVLRCLRRWSLRCSSSLLPLLSLLFLHRHLKATAAEGGAAAARLTQEVQPPCCRWEVHSSVLFAALAVAAPVSREAEIPRMVLEREVIQNKAGVLLYEEPEFVYIGGN